MSRRMTAKQRDSLESALRVLSRARRSADHINPYSYGYGAEENLVGPPTPVPLEYAVGYAAKTLERLLQPDQPGDRT